MAEAEAACHAVLRLDAQQPLALRLLGLIELARGELLAAEQWLGRSLRVQAEQAESWHGLGEVQEGLLRPTDAEACYRRAAELQAGWAEAHYNRARMLRLLGHADLARQAVQQVLQLKPDMANAWQLLAMLQQDEHQLDAALHSLAQALRLAPERAALHHNRAVLLQCSHRHTEALAAHERALALGLAAADAHYNHGNTLLSLGRTELAAAAYRQALTVEPLHALALYDLARLRWSQGEDEFLAELEAAERAAPQSATLRGIKAQLLLKAGRYAEAAAAFRRASFLAPQVAAHFDGLAQALGSLGQLDAALHAHQQALLLAPADAAVRSNQVRGLLAAGRVQEAAVAAAQALELAPDDQHTLALQGLAWRLQGDARELVLNDYDRLLRVFDLPAPLGWADMDSFNVELAEELTALHTDREAPIDQTLRHGTQTHDNLLAQTWPLVERLKPLLRQAINQYIDELPADASHPFLRRRSKSWRFTGSWSSSLRSSGFHTNHVHTQGWISACYYVAVPPAVLDGGMQAGWIKFGEPDLPLGLVAARSVQPQCGRLVLFPSCFWHGTVPFSDERVRLTVAFDIKPS